VHGSQSATVKAFAFVADLIVNIAVLEHAQSLLSPLLLAKAPLNPALAIPQTSPYLGIHLKYLRAGGKGISHNLPISPQMPRYFKHFSRMNTTKQRWTRLFWG